jgi:hypothetical protein
MFERFGCSHVDFSISFIERQDRRTIAFGGVEFAPRSVDGAIPEIRRSRPTTRPGIARPFVSILGKEGLKLLNLFTMEK